MGTVECVLYSVYCIVFHLSSHPPTSPHLSHLPLPSPPPSSLPPHQLTPLHPLLSSTPPHQAYCHARNIVRLCVYTILAIHYTLYTRHTLYTKHTLYTRHTLYSYTQRTSPYRDLNTQVHRDLKPDNILFVHRPRMSTLMAPVSSYILSTLMAPVSSYILSTLMAPVSSYILSTLMAPVSVASVVEEVSGLQVQPV
jgi:serine/threonine protein kinase